MPSQSEKLIIEQFQNRDAVIESLRMQALTGQTAPETTPPAPAAGETEPDKATREIQSIAKDHGVDVGDFKKISYREMIELMNASPGNMEKLLETSGQNKDWITQAKGTLLLKAAAPPPPGHGGYTPTKPPSTTPQPYDVSNPDSIKAWANDPNQKDDPTAQSIKALGDKFGYNHLFTDPATDPSRVTNQMIVGSFTPEEIDRYHLLPTGAHEFVGVGPEGDYQIVQVTVGDYYKIKDLPKDKQPQALIDMGVYPKGSTITMDPKGLGVPEVYPGAGFAIVPPEMEKKITTAVAAEAEYQSTLKNYEAAQNKLKDFIDADGMLDVQGAILAKAKDADIILLLGGGEAAKEAVKQAHHEINTFKKELATQPKELRDAYRLGGFEAYEKAYDVYKESVDAQIAKAAEVRGELDKYHKSDSFKKLPTEIRDKFNIDDMTAFIGALDDYNAAIESQNTKQENAFTRLLDVVGVDTSKMTQRELERLPERNLVYDFDKLASFARLNKDWEQVLKDAKFENTDELINSLKEYNNAPLGKDEFTRRYYQDKGWLPTLEPEGSASIGLKILTGRAKDIKNVFPGVSSEELERRKKEVSKAYDKEYGKVASGLYDVGTDLSLIFPAARVLRPDVELKDVSGAEWAISFAQLGLFALPVVGAFARPLVATAAAGIFTMETVNNWSSMSPQERAISVAFDVLILAGVAGSLRGVKPKTVEPIKINAKAAITEIAKTEPKTPQAKVYDAGYDFTDAVMKASEKVRAETGGTIPIEKMQAAISKALSKIKYEAGGIKIDVAKLAENIKGELVKLGSEKGAGLALNKDTQGVVRAALQRAKYELGNAKINIVKLNEAINKGIAKLQSERGTGVILDKDIQGVVRTAIGKLKYEAGNVKIVASQISRNISNGLYRLSTERGETFISNEKVDGFIRSALGRAGYEIKGAKIKIESLVADIQDGLRRLSSERGGTALLEKDIEGAIYKILKKSKYKLTGSAIKLKAMARTISRDINKFNSDRGGDITLSKDYEGIIRTALKKAGYEAKGVKLTGDALKRGIDDAVAKRSKLSPAELKRVLKDIETTIKNSDIEGLKRAGKELETIGEQIPKEQGGEVISRQGRQLVDKGAEIVKIAEKRLKMHQVKDLTDRIKVNDDFISSPSERTIGRAKALDNAIESTKKEIGSTNSALDNLETQEARGKAKVEPEKPKYTKAEIETEKVRLMQEISRDNAKLAELRNKGGEPRDIQMLNEKIIKNYDKLWSLEKTTTPEINKAKLRETLQDRLDALRVRLNSFERQKAQISGGKAGKLWGAKVVEGERGESLKPGREEPPFEKPTRDRGKTITKTKTEVRPKTAEELERELLPEKEKVKPETKPETEKPVKTEEIPKTKERTDTTTGTPLKVPQTVGEPYWALVWENGRLYVKKIIPEELPEGFIRSAEQGATQEEIAQRYKELTKLQPKEATKKLIQEYPNPASYPVIVKEPEPTPEKQPQPELQPQKEKQPMPERVGTKTKIVPEPTPVPTPHPIPEPEPETGKVLPPPPPEETKKGGIILLGGGSDKEKREVIKQAGGAIAWRMGKVGGKDRWDTVINPYQSNAQYLMVLGKPPAGATIIKRGKGSAKATAQMLRGQPPRKPFKVDSGFIDIGISARGRQVNAEFTPDPKGLTTGDITIGQPSPRITTPAEPISRRGTRLPGRSVRITPKMPRLR